MEASDILALLRYSMGMGDVPMMSDPIFWYGVLAGAGAVIFLIWAFSFPKGVA